MSLFDEPKQQPQSQHIIGDERSKVWLEVKDDALENYPALVSTSLTWVAVSALVYKLVRALTFIAPVSLIVCVCLLLLIPVAFVLYKRSLDDSKRFGILVYATLVVLGLVIGGL